jgi:hypothetical protein
MIRVLAAAALLGAVAAQGTNVTCPNPLPGSLYQYSVSDARRAASPPVALRVRAAAVVARAVCGCVCTAGDACRARR